CTTDLLWIGYLLYW
nr:immunoglobulin heavy chain junction region [Macaca mulatta]MOV50231.1 immunoglobulin heavy chain junction region [Macaca mulatta]MOV52468.1 immunoglobulin heavy chain junction region [Macaca mulatta]MOV52758.1 immunoglobulin heavy chain junction region [Macaca mulatta]